MGALSIKKKREDMNGLSIIRNRLAFENNFTQIPNSWARDSRIGFRAKGILVLLMSHSDGWMTSLEEMAKQSNDGITAIRSAVEQLENCGYLIRTKVRDDFGRYRNAEWILNDPFESPSLENPTVDKPQVDKPTVENQTLKNTNIKENQLEEYKQNNKFIELAFSQFWEIYPRKEGKGAARSAYLKALKKYPNSAKQINDGARRYAHNPAIPEKKFIPHPSTWLNQERWLDEDLPTGDQKSNSTDIARDIIERANNLDNQKPREIEDGH